MRKGSASILLIFFVFLTLFLFITDLGIGSVAVPLPEVWKALFGSPEDPAVKSIIVDIRLVKALTALIAGAALSVSGLQMQTLFRNPLAGPYVLGVSSGASLGVALFILGSSIFGFSASSFPLGMAGAAWIGSALILLIVAVAARRIKNIMAILILGMMISSGIAAIVQILQYLSREDSLKRFVIWTMGSLGDITYPGLFVLIGGCAIGFFLAVLTLKPLNLLLLGEDYARSMGMNVTKSRNLLFLSTTLLAGSVTAFCGPIGFIGLAIPHICRMIFNTSDHRIIIPGSFLVGASVLIFCDMLSKIFTLPINAITSLIGIPVILWIVLRNKSLNV